MAWDHRLGDLSVFWISNSSFGKYTTKIKKKLEPGSTLQQGKCFKVWFNPFNIFGDTQNLNVSVCNVIFIHKLGHLIQLPKLKCAEPLETPCAMQNINTGLENIRWNIFLLCPMLLDSLEIRSIISSSTKNFVF